MIRVHRGFAPVVLREKAAEWTTELLTLLRKGVAVPANVWRRYAHSDIKQKLRGASHGKCAYCESKITHIYFGDVEHIRPKSRFPNLTYSWENLGFVCAVCNSTKKDHYDEVCPPINPYEEDPEDFFIAVGQYVWPKAGNDRARITISMVELNRSELLERRRTRMEQIQALAEIVVRTAGSPVYEVFHQQLCDELADRTEYAFITRQIARSLEQGC